MAEILQTWFTWPGPIKWFPMCQMQEDTVPHKHSHVIKKKQLHDQSKDPEKYTPTHKHTHPLRVYANVGPICRWMHGKNTQNQRWCQRTYPTGIKIVIPATYQYFMSVRKWENLCTHYWVNSSVGLVYRWMHDVYRSISIMAWKISPWISKLYYQSNIHISWKSKGEKIFYTRVIIWVNAILIHSDSRVILARYEGSSMVYRPEWYRKQKYGHMPTPTGIKKM